MAHFKFAPELFRTGTVFRLNNEGHFRKYHSLEFTAQRVIRNGINSYVVETTTPANRPGEPKAFDDKMMQSFHIDHIDAIVKAGAGPLDIEYDEYGTRAVEMTYNDMVTNQVAWSGVHVRGNKRSRTYYQIFSIYALVAHLHLKFMKSGHYVFDAEKCQLELTAQSFLRAHRLLGHRMSAHCAPKKRVDAWFKANMNRFLYPVKKAQKEHDAAMDKIYAEDFDRDMDLLDRDLERSHEADHPVEAKAEEGSHYSEYDREEGHRRDDQAREEANELFASLPPAEPIYTGFSLEGGKSLSEVLAEQQARKTLGKMAESSEAPHFLGVPLEKLGVDWTQAVTPAQKEMHRLFELHPQEPIQVKFPMNREIWDKVVVDSQEKMNVESESQSDFVVEYETPEDFVKATTRFEGLIEYEVLTTPELQTRDGEVIPRNPSK